MEEKNCNRILLYGLKADEMEQVMKVLSGCEFKYATDWQDIIAIPADLIIANLKDASDECKKTVAQYYKEIEPAEVRLILVEYISELEKIKSVEYIKEFLENEKIIRVTALKCLHESKRDVDFSERISRILMVMRDICKYPGISTKELSDRFEVSERSIKRYIDTLRMSGAEIEYKNRGWHCVLALWDY